MLNLLIIYKEKACSYKNNIEIDKVKILTLRIKLSEKSLCIVNDILD